MASIASTPLWMQNAASADQAAAGATAKKPEKPEEDTLANKDVFIKLLVAQLQNQNPMSPSDPIQFLTQLAQFTSLEQSMQMSQDLSSIRTGIDSLVKLGTPPADAAGDGSGEAGT